MKSSGRQTTQALAPLGPVSPPPGGYDLYPAYPWPQAHLESGFPALARRFPDHGEVVCDGFVGVFWEDFRAQLDQALGRRGLKPRWVDVSGAWRPEAEVEAMLQPFLGADDPLFGRKFTEDLDQFFDAGRLAALPASETACLTIYYGCGAALVRPDAWLVYLDLPKNELQYRARAGGVTNLGTRSVRPPRETYKRLYFIDWPALNAHKKALASRVDLVVDAQRPGEPVFTTGTSLRAALEDMALNWCRARPWFEPGPWGGQWCRRRIPALPEAPNYAWSFELITPENGLMVTDGKRLLEVSFDWLMFLHGPRVLGQVHARFGDEFPIRFDFLDTVEGGNLSIQVHPSPGMIQREFGETITQDETYYILDAVPGARVHLGFQEGIDREQFKAALETSARHATPVDMERYVRSLPSRKHQLFLIPHGTVHGSGAGNLVLEISATPYIYTFKLYDWLRLDLDGRPRPLNLERGLASLNFGRRGRVVEEELVSRAREVARGDGWVLEHLPTHADHFFDVHRYRFEREVEVATENGVRVLSLVEGTCIELETARGRRQRFHYAETFVVPAAAERFRLINRGTEPALVVLARIKP